jgi:hypothetical protein
MAEATNNSESTLNNEQAATLRTYRTLAVALVIFGGASVAIALAPINSCDMLDAGTDLTMNHWLLGLGGLFLAIPLMTLITMFGLLLCGDLFACCIGLSTVVTVLCSCAYFPWAIVGAVVLFRSNMDCLHTGSPNAIWTLVNVIISWLLCCCAPMCQRRLTLWMLRSSTMADAPDLEQAALLDPSRINTRERDAALSLAVNQYRPLDN